MICSIASKNRNFNNMDGIFKNLGFNIIAEVPEYWSDESIEKATDVLYVKNHLVNVALLYITLLYRFG